MSSLTLSVFFIYLSGFFMSLLMLRVEHEAEGKTFTNLDRILSLVFSLLSFLMVLTLLVSTWLKKIGATGYWNRPVHKRSQ